MLICVNKDCKYETIFLVHSRINIAANKVSAASYIHIFSESKEKQELDWHWGVC